MSEAFGIEANLLITRVKLISDRDLGSMRGRHGKRNGHTKQGVASRHSGGAAYGAGNSRIHGHAILRWGHGNLGNPLCRTHHISMSRYRPWNLLLTYYSNRQSS